MGLMYFLKAFITGAFLGTIGAVICAFWKNWDIGQSTQSIARRLERDSIAAHDPIPAFIRTRSSRPRQGNSAGAATLSSLPPELLENVAQHLSSIDICVLRLASRDMAFKVLQTTFTREHFAKRSCLMFSLSGLETVLEIARHPILGRALRELVFYVDTVSPPEGSGRVGEYLLRSYHQRQRGVFEDQGKLVAQFDTLSEVFQQLQRYDQLRKIVIMSVRNTAQRYRYDRHKVEPPNAEVALHRLEFALMMLPGKGFTSLSALAMEGDMVCIRTPEYFNTRTTPLFSIQYLRTPFVGTALFENLASLTMTLQTDQSDYEIGMRHLLLALSRNTALTHLDLYFMPHGFEKKTPFSDSWSATMLMAASFRKLKILQVRCFKTCLSNLRSFVRRNSTLEKIILVEYASIGLRVAEYDAWETSIHGGGHALTMIKNEIGVRELEGQLRKDVMLFRCKR